MKCREARVTLQLPPEIAIFSRDNCLNRHRFADRTIPLSLVNNKSARKTGWIYEWRSARPDEVINGAQSNFIIEVIKVIEKSGEQMVVSRYSWREGSVNNHISMYRCLKLVSRYVSIHLHERTINNRTDPICLIVYFINCSKGRSSIREKRKIDPLSEHSSRRIRYVS